MSDEGVPLPPLPPRPPVDAGAAGAAAPDPARTGLVGPHLVEASAAGGAGPSRAASQQKPLSTGPWLVPMGFALDALALLWMASSLPAYARAFHVPQDVAGIVFTTNSLGFVVTAPVVGLLADRWGKRRVGAASALGLGIGLCLFAASPSLPLALLASLVVGAGAGAFESTLSALLPDLYPGREGYANNIAQVFFSAGATLAPPLLLLRGLGWRVRLAACGIALGLLLPAFRTGRSRGHPTSPPPVPAALRLRRVVAVLGEGGVAPLVIAMVLYTGVEVAVWGWLYAVMTRTGGPGPGWAVAELSGFWAAMGLGRWASARLSRRWPLPALVAAEAACGLPALWFALRTPGGIAGLLAASGCGLALSGIWPSLVGLAQERHGASAFLTAVMVAAGGAGGLFVPAAFGVLATHLGLSPATAVLDALLAPVAVLPFLRPRPAPPSGSSPASGP
jgi:fucose permease